MLGKNLKCGIKIDLMIDEISFQTFVVLKHRFKFLRLWKVINYLILHKECENTGSQWLYDSALIGGNTGQWKPVFSHTLSSVVWNSSSSRLSHVTLVYIFKKFIFKCLSNPGCFNWFFLLPQPLSPSHGLINTIIFKKELALTMHNFIAIKILDRNQNSVEFFLTRNWW